MYCRLIGVIEWLSQSIGLISIEEKQMSKQAAEHHSKAAEHHEHAARHHREAARHHDSGNYETAAHHAHSAQGHLHHATHHAIEAAKSHLEHHGSKSKAAGH